MTVTFVTAFVEIGINDKSVDLRIEQFRKLNASGVRLHVFVSPEHVDKLPTIDNGVIELISLTDLEMYAISPQGLPDIRKELKDTRDFLILMNAKTELVHRAIKSEKHTPTHYAWIDFNIYHILTDPEASDNLAGIAHGTLPSKCLFVPGCWQSGVIWDSVNWRFCGGFFVGDRESLLSFHDANIREYPTLPKLTWEVNTWAYLESIGVHFDWYPGDHNNSILHVMCHAQRTAETDH